MGITWAGVRYILELDAIRVDEDCQCSSITQHPSCLERLALGTSS